MMFSQIRILVLFLSFTMSAHGFVQSGLLSSFTDGFKSINPFHGLIAGLVGGTPKDPPQSASRAGNDPLSGVLGSLGPLNPMPVLSQVKQAPARLLLRSTEDGERVVVRMDSNIDGE